MVWVDYKQLRDEVPIAKVMTDYGIELRGSGDQKKATCPLDACRDEKGLSFSVNVAKGLWKCWRCGARGNVIDFAAQMENLNPADTEAFRQAAVKLAEKYGVAGTRPADGKKSHGKQRFRKTNRRQGGQQVYVNQALDFELKDLDSKHASVATLGLKSETVEFFGLGFCNRRGMFQGRVVAPLHDCDGNLVGYAGRLVDEQKASADDPLYKYPDKERVRRSDNAALIFDRSKLVYNANRLDIPVDDLLVVEHLHDVWRLHDAGFPNAVVIFSPTSDEQMRLIEQAVAPTGTVWFLTDAGEPLRALVQVAKVRSVRWEMRIDENPIESLAEKVI